ncbi:tetratricopeptide repeat protein, partial [Klebsiella pneumoniae]|uniref:tetratricopeptide repeat protein n=1 Tax=Klebsiella pneumoniae TaxID=573 RepID=UPI003A88AB8B
GAGFYVGQFYDFGIGIEEDMEQAVKWYQRAADQDEPRARARLGFCYYCGEGVEQDLKKAAALFLRAAEQGDISGQYNLA